MCLLLYFFAIKCQAYTYLVNLNAAELMAVLSQNSLPDTYYTLLITKEQLHF